MGNDTSIGWTDHTFNPWWGCTKISPGCTNCYAHSMDRRWGGAHWGINAERRFFEDKHWNAPLRWNAAAQQEGARARVFCASMADVFEDRVDLVPHRNRLWSLIQATPHLDWLLLTKRPENFERFVPWVIGSDKPWANVWLGVTAENQEYADVRIPLLIGVPAVVHFLSCEPLLEHVVFEPKWFKNGVSWVIGGTESGSRRRTTNPIWLRSLRNQSMNFGAAFFLRQAEPDVELITIGNGSVAKGPVVEAPYLDGVQHLAFPKVRAPTYMETKKYAPRTSPRVGI